MKTYAEYRKQVEEALSALLRRWGLPEGLVGVGNCVLGYAAGDIPAAAPRKADFVKFVD